MLVCAWVDVLVCVCVLGGVVACVLVCVWVDVLVCVCVGGCIGMCVGMGMNFVYACGWVY